MTVKRMLVLAVVVVTLGACRGERRMDVTGSYGSSVLAGQVVLDGIDGTPEGVEVSVRDTGMRTVLSADGRFAFAGVPENAILDFRRSDGINASLAVNGKGSITVELGKSGASKGKGRGNNTKDKREFEGVIKAASAEEITLLTSKKEEILIGLSTETIIRKGNELLTPADLTVDMRVHVRARKQIDGKLVAQLVIVQNDGDDGEDDDKPAVREFEGTIVSATDQQLVVFTSHKVEMTFALTADTRIRKGHTPVLPAELLPGQRVHVKATVTDEGAATALQVVVQNTHDDSGDEVEVEGTVVSVSGSDLVVHTASGDVTVKTDASTRIRKKGKTIGVGDIVAGDVVKARGTKVSDTEILATEVEVRGKSGHP